MGEEYQLHDMISGYKSEERRVRGLNGAVRAQQRDHRLR